MKLLTAIVTIILTVHKVQLTANPLMNQNQVLHKNQINDRFNKKTAHGDVSAIKKSARPESHSPEITLQKRQSPAIVTSIYVDSMLTKDEKGLPHRRYTVTYYPNGRRKILLLKLWNGDQWENAQRDSFAYDAKGNDTSLVQKQWQGGQWINLYWFEYAYDASGNMTMEYYHTWDGKWSNFSRYTMTYDADGNVTSQLYEGSDDGISLINDTRDTYTYASQNRMLTSMSEVYDKAKKVWVKTYRQTLTYDTRGNNMTFLLDEWGKSDWVHFSRDTYVYDANGYQLSDVMEEWRTESAAWELAEKDTYTIDANGNTLTDLLQDWNGGLWENIRRTTFAYDSRRNMTLNLEEEWDGTKWVGYEELTFTYNANDDETSGLAKFWQTNQWVNKWRTTSTYTAYFFPASSSYEEWKANVWAKSPYAFYTYDWSNSKFEADGCEANFYYSNTISEVSQNTAFITSYSLAQNFPNPFNPSTTISFSLSIKSFVTLKIFDVMGREASTVVSGELPAGNYSKQWNASGFPSGMYFYRLQAGEYAETKRLILLR